MLGVILGVLGALGGSFTPVVEHNPAFENISQAGKNFENSSERADYISELVAKNGTVSGYSNQSVTVEYEKGAVTTRVVGTHLLTSKPPMYNVSDECFQSSSKLFHEYMRERVYNKTVRVVPLQTNGTWISHVVMAEEQKYLGVLLLERGLATPRNYDKLGAIERGRVRDASTTARDFELGIWNCIPEDEEGKFLEDSGSLSGNSTTSTSDSSA